jgi:hypothetical protein
LEPISKALVLRLDDQQALTRQTIEARVRGMLSDSDFQTLKASITAEIDRIQDQIKALDSGDLHDGGAGQADRA